MRDGQPMHVHFAVSVNGMLIPSILHLLPNFVVSRLAEFHRYVSVG